ncbi:MAG: TRAP transporter small permease [Desulfobacterales bacterium]|jgi:TRAP-type C4-dicarboxylate transport system permease small subunit
MLDKFEKFNRRLSEGAQWVGLAALLLIVVLTCVDVVGAKVFRAPVFGALDVVILAQLIAVSFAVAIALIMGRHVSVEFFIMLLPKRLRSGIECVVNLLGLGLFIVIVWQLFVYGYGMQVGGEESMTARIPLAPFAYAAAVGIIPVCLIYLQKLLTSIIKMVKNES